jgi:hypothetical protein
MNVNRKKKYSQNSNKQIGLKNLQKLIQRTHYKQNYNLMTFLITCIVTLIFIIKQ